MSSPTETAPTETAPIKTAAHPYRQLVARRIALVLGLSLLLCLSIAVDVSLGPARYALRDVAATLIWPEAADLQMRVVVWDIRLPMALMAVTVGGCLSLAGAQMQTILANPLASPFTLGLSAAASFGAALAMVLGVALFPAALALMVPINAFVMAMLAALLIFALSSMRGVTVETIVLLGIALVFTFNAALALLQYFASEQALAAVVFWTMGSLTKASWDKVAVTAAILVVCTPLFARRAWALTAIRLGEARASAMGVPVRRLRLEALVLVSVLAAIPVSFVGTIGFIGIVGPHIARLLLGEDQRFFLPGAILSGALILSATSVLSKAILPGAVLPIGIITALVGGAVFRHADLYPWKTLMVTLELDRVEARYGRKVIYTDATTPAISGGNLTALIGPNAAGKSTLFRRIAGQLAGSGQVRITGADRDDLRYMPQDTAMSAALSVYEAVILALKQGRSGWRLSAGELAAVDAILARLKITALAERQLAELSGGQRQLISIAQTLVSRPRLVLMDEPTSALDLYRQYEVLELLRSYAAETGAVVVLALHDLNQVMRSCTTTIAVAEGRVVAVGPTLEVLSPALIRRLYAIESRVETCSRGCPMMIVDGALEQGA